jgi:hypothetical protein
MVNKTYFTKCGHEDNRLPPKENVGITPKQLKETCAACTWKIFEDARGVILLKYFNKRLPVRTEHVKLLRRKTAAGVFGKASKDLDEEIKKWKERLDRMANQCDSDIKESRKENHENRWGPWSSEGTGVMARRSKDLEVDEDVIRGLQEENNAPLRALIRSSASP